MNEVVNQDLKNLINWMDVNKICLNISKTETVLFKSTRKHKDVLLKMKLSEKRLHPTNSMKYLGIKIDEKLIWKTTN